MKPPFLLIVAGSREFKDYSHMKEQLDKLLLKKMETHTVAIVSGGARGADELGERYAAESGLHVIIMPACWEALGKVAGPVRNEMMAILSDAAAIFWNGESRGSKNLIDTVGNMGKPNRVFKYLERDNK